MTNPEILRTLAHLHELLRELVRALPDAEVNRAFDPVLGCIGWQLGESVYRETYWLREVLVGDARLTAPIQRLFDARPGDGRSDRAADCAALPPSRHLLAWAAEVQDEHLRRLATPGALPDHPLMAEDRLAWYLTQEAAHTYERMIALLWLRRLASDAQDAPSDQPLRTALPKADFVEVIQGHYRIGSRFDPRADDYELPPQAVELASFRMARQPVSNAEFLGFIEGGGYTESAYWPPDGLAWRNEQTTQPKAPLGWRRDGRGSWYEIGLNGPCALPSDHPVAGINRHEARAFAAWAAGLGGAQSGAVLQHEYQWEVAARGGLIEGIGRAWEWCANDFHLYPNFKSFMDPDAPRDDVLSGYGVLRGGSLHTRPCLRRASYRFAITPETREFCAGLRLVYPPA